MCRLPVWGHCDYCDRRLKALSDTDQHHLQWRGSHVSFVFLQTLGF